MHYLYKITNTQNNKVYIGQTNDADRRWRVHKSYAKNPTKTGQYVHRAMSKYGIESFVYEVIAQCLTQEDADETEIHLIEQHDSRNPNSGYNLSPGGDHAWNAGLPTEQQPMYGRHHTEESRRKISENNMGKKMPSHTDEWKRRSSSWLTGRPVSKETRKKISEGNRGKVMSVEARSKISRGCKGKNTGEKHSQSKLTWELVRQLRLEYATGFFTQKKLAEKYGIAPPTLRSIIKYETWKE